MLVVNQYLDTVAATGRVLRDLIDGLADRGYNIRAIAGPADAVHEQQQGSGRVFVRRVRATRFSRSNLALRALNYVTFLLWAAIHLTLSRRPGIIICMSDPPPLALVSITIGRLRRVPVVAVMQDIHPDLGVVSGRLTNPLVVSVLRVAQRIVVKRADRLVAIGLRMGERLVEKGAPRERVAVIPNWVDTTKLRPRSRDNSWSRELGLGEGPRVMHAGNIGQLQSLETVVAAAGLLPEVSFLIVGDGSTRNEISQLVKGARLDNVRLIPHQPAARLEECLSAADIHIVSLVRGLAGLMEPSKVYGILAVGRPVVAAVDYDSEAARVVHAAGCGFVTPPMRSDAMANAIAHLVKDPQKAIRMGGAARHYAERWANRDHAIEAYDRLLEDVGMERARKAGQRSARLRT